MLKTLAATGDQPEATNLNGGTARMTDALATVIVLNWNGRRLLPACLDALSKQDLPDGQMQVWMVDNASADDSVALVERDYPWVRVIRNHRNDGFAGGNNLALRQVTTPYAVLLNNDTTPEPSWLRELLAPLRTADDPQLAAATAKLVFQPRFVPLSLTAPGFKPPGDPRHLGVRVSRVQLQQPDGAWQDITEGCLWEHVAYGPETHAGTQFRWTHPAGTVLLPTHDITTVEGGEAALHLRLTLQAERDKDLTLTWPGGSAIVPVGSQPGEHAVTMPLVPEAVTDVVNNVGVVLHAPGYGADRGYQQLDQGQYDTPEEVFGFCGGACALRTDVLRQVGVLDDDFFMYYEDTDLSWRLRAAGYHIRYVPTAVVRHEHAASSKEWSPFFTFHVERNRLLMLLKNAPTRLAAGQLARFLLTTASMTLRGLRTPGARRATAHQTWLRARVLASLLRLTPRLLTKRRAINQHRQVPTQTLTDRWMLPSKPE